MNRHVECGGGFVSDEDIGVERNRHCDHDALTHTTGKLVWIVTHTVSRGRNTHTLHQFDRAVAGVFTVHALALAQHLGDLPPNREQRVERGQRILEHHRDVLPADFPTVVFRHFQNVTPAEQNFTSGHKTGWGVQNSHNRLGRDGFTRPRLTQDGERLSFVNRVVHSVDGFHDTLLCAELNREVAHVQEWLLCRVVVVHSLPRLWIESVAHNVTEHNEREYTQAQRGCREQHHVRSNTHV